MVKNFSRIKKRLLLSAFLSAFAIGISVGVIAFSALLILAKALIFKTELTGYIACMCIALAAFAVSLLIFFPAKKRLAKRLDRKYALDERVSTMLEFEKSDEPLAILQRNDTDERLGNLKVAFFKRSQLITVAVTFILAAAVLTAAFIVPAKKPSAPEEPTVSEFDKELIIAELNELVATVDSSMMSDKLRSDSSSELKALIEFVKTHDYMSEMKLEAISKVIIINTALKNINSAPRVGEALTKCSDPILAELGREFINMSGTKSKKLIDELRDSLQYADPEDISFAADEIGAALSLAGASTDNTLIDQLSNLESALRGAANGLSAPEDAFSGLPLSISNEVMIQNLNKMTIQSIISKLCGLFGISSGDLNEVEGGESIDTRPPSGVNAGEEETETEDPDKPISEGGIGTGDRVYGSNDIIYDPNSNAYVTYGTLLDEYNAKATDKILDGRINEDFKRFIEEYFKNLSEYTPSESDN